MINCIDRLPRFSSNTFYDGSVHFITRYMVVRLLDRLTTLGDDSILSYISHLFDLTVARVVNITE
jgi:hypothetical protein